MKAREEGVLKEVRKSNRESQRGENRRNKVTGSEAKSSNVF